MSTPPQVVITASGVPGATGPAGAPGAVGHTPQMYSGAGAPSVLHADGDLYADTASGTWYQQQAGAWVSMGVIATPPGGAASGDLGGTFPAPTVTTTHLASPLPIAQGGTGAASPGSALAALSGTPISAVRAINSATVAANPWDVLECSAVSNPITVTLPTNVAGVRVTVKKTDASANTVTISGTVDGSTNPTLAYQYGSIELVADGTAWVRVVRPSVGALVDWPATPDARYIQQSATAGGDLAGTLPFPTVARVNGVAVTGTPASGYVPTATGGTAATWQALPAATTTVSGIVRLDGTSTDITGLGATAAGAVGKSADAGHVHAAYEWMPADQGLVAWNFDPSMASTTWVPTSTTNGNLFLTAIILRSPTTVTNVVYGLSGAQTSGLTTGENLIGLYNASGTLLTQTADQTAVWSSSGNVKVNIIPWAAPQALAAGKYFVAWLYNGVTAGAALNFKASGAGTTANAGQTGASLRYGMITGTATTLPTPITLGSMATPVPFNNQWVGLS